MMLKWIGRFLFVIITVVLSLQVYYYAQYSKLQKYYQEHMLEHINDDDIYLQGVNTLADLDYYQNEPIYEYISSNSDYNFKLAIRAIGADVYDRNNNIVKVDGLMLFLNHIEIKDVELPVIKITVTLDQNSIRLDSDETFTNEAVMIYNPNEGFPQSNIPVLFLLNAETSLLLDNKTSKIDSIKIEYGSSYSKDEKTMFNEIALFIASVNPIDEAAYVKDPNFIIENDDFLLLKQFENNDPNDNDIIIYNLITAKDNLNKYNNIVWRTMIAYGLIVIIVGYFVFFHKKFYEKLKMKKQKSQN